MTREEIIEGLNLLEDNMVYFDKLQNDKGTWIDVHKLLFEAIEALEQEPCEDCISRQATVERLCKVAEFMNEKRNGLGSPYVMAALFIQDNKDEFPPVTPKPKTGHWVFVQRGKYVDIKCSECENVRVKEYAYNYTVEQVLADKENIAELLAEGDMQWCPYCGAKMESEG